MAKIDIQSTDRRVKWLLLVVSLATLALLIVAALQENVFTEWRSTRAAYAKILKRKATDSAGRTIAKQFKTGPDQHILPELDRVDRCVTCHAGIDDARMEDQQQPFRAHPGNILSIHPASKFGCTICHQGQGLATSIPDAHGHVPFWPEPMIDSRYAYAGCGSCHVHAGVPHRAGMAEARSAFERHDCFACHRIDGRGGTLRPDGSGGMEGPDLSAVGLAGYDPLWYEQHLRQRNGVGGDDGPDLTHEGDKTSHQLDFTHVEGEHTPANWHAEHLRNPSKVVPDSKMPAVDLAEEEIERLTLYLLSLRRHNLPDTYWPPDRVRIKKLHEREFATDGATMYAALCSACHGERGQGRRLAGRPLEVQPAFPAIANADFLAVASDAFLRENIRRGRMGRRMPAWEKSAGGLRDSEIDLIVAHLRKMGGGVEAEADPREPRWVKADPDRGKFLYAAHCASCHGKQGEGAEASALNNKVFLATAGDTYLVETIGRGRRDTKMSLSTPRGERERKCSSFAEACRFWA